MLCNVDLLKSGVVLVCVVEIDSCVYNVILDVVWMKGILCSLDVGVCD